MTTPKARQSESDRMDAIALWRCPDCEWVGFSEDGHCRQFDEHPDGPRIPLEPVEYVPAQQLRGAVAALREIDERSRGWMDHAGRLGGIARKALDRLGGQ